MGTAYGNSVLVTKIKLRIVWREFAHSVRTTLEGKLAVAFMVAAPFLMKNLLVSSALRQAGMTEDFRWVALWTAHLFMMATVVLFVAARTARSLCVHRRDEALVHYPHARQGLAAFHFWGETVGANAFLLLALFYLFYGALVSALALRPVMGTLLHVIGHAVVILALGAVAYRLTLRALERRPTWARTVFDVTSYGGALVFVLIAAGPLFLVDVSPGQMGSLRSMFDGVGRFYPPVAGLAASTVRPGPLLGWLVELGVLGALALAAAAPLIQTPSTLLLGEVQSPVSRGFKSVFGRRKRPPTHRVLHDARLFFLKDVVLGAIRSPRGFIRRQSVFFGMAGLAAYLAWGLLEEDLIGQDEAEALLLGLVVFLVCFAGYIRGLGCLGSEGPALALLRPAVRPSELMSYKMVGALACVVPAGLAYGLAAGLLSRGLHLGPGPLVTAGIGGLAALVAAAFAVSLAFLFPDFRRRNVLVPGASRTGRYAFLSAAFYGAGLVAGLWWTTRSGMLPSSLFVPSLMTTAGVGLVLTRAVAAVALRRFPHLEY